MLDITDSALERLARDDPSGPFVMLNLLRFRPDGGRETYQRYVEATVPLAAKYGAEVV